jgi:hypothetical protein
MLPPELLEFRFHVVFASASITLAAATATAAFATMAAPGTSYGYDS